MHTIKLSVSDNIYAQILSLFQTFPSNELKVVEDTPSFVVSDVNEAKKRAVIRSYLTEYLRSQFSQAFQVAVLGSQLLVLRE